MLVIVSFPNYYLILVTSLLGTFIIISFLQMRTLYTAFPCLLMYVVKNKEGVKLGNWDPKLTFLTIHHPFSTTDI